MAAKVWPGYSGTPSGQWELIGDSEIVSGSPVQNLDFDTILSTRWDAYQIDFKSGAPGTVSSLSLRLNSGNAAGHCQEIYSSNGASIAAAELTVARIGAIKTMGIHIIVDLDLSTPRTYMARNSMIETATSIFINRMSGYLSSGDAVVGLGIYSETGSYIPVGAVAKLYGRVA